MDSTLASMWQPSFVRLCLRFLAALKAVRPDEHLYGWVINSRRCHQTVVFL
jgi:hypothetical protein